MSSERAETLAVAIPPGAVCLMGGFERQLFCGKVLVGFLPQIAWAMSSVCGLVVALLAAACTDGVHRLPSFGYPEDRYTVLDPLCVVLILVLVCGVFAVCAWSVARLIWWAARWAFCSFLRRASAKMWAWRENVVLAIGAWCGWMWRIQWVRVAGRAESFRAGVQSVRERVASPDFQKRLCEQLQALRAVRPAADFKLVDCDCCRAAAVEILGDEYAEFVAKYWVGGQASHKCPFEYPDGCMLALASLVLNVESAVGHLTYEAKGKASAEAPNKGKNCNKDRHKAAVERVRAAGGKRGVVHHKLAPDEYEYLVGLVDMGRDEEAAEQAMDMYQDQAHALQEDEVRYAYLEDRTTYGNMGERGLEGQVCAIRENYARQAANRARVVVGKIKAGRKHRAEAPRPRLTEAQEERTKRAVEYLRGVASMRPCAESGEKTLICTDSFEYHEAEKVAQVMEEYLAVSLASESNHRAVVSERMEETKGSKGKKGAMNREVKAMAESASRGSKLITPRKLGVRALNFLGTISQGLLFRGPGNVVAFVTNRHAYPAGKPVCRFRDAASRCGEATMHIPGKPDVQVEVKSVRTSDCDRAVLILEGPVGEFKNPPIADPQELLESRDGNKTVCLWTYKDGDFYESHGPLRHVADDGTFFYELTTEPGMCRAPVFTSDGRLLGGHYHPGITIGGNNCPGGEPEPLSVPKSYSSVYAAFRIRRIAGEAQTYRAPIWSPNDEMPEGLDFFPPAPGGRVEARKLCTLRPGVAKKGVNPRYVWAKPSTAMNHLEMRKFGGVHKFVCSEARMRKAMSILVHLEGDSFSHTKGSKLEDWILVVDELGRKDSTSAGSTGDGATQYDYVMETGGSDSYEVNVERVAQRCMVLNGLLEEYGLDDDAIPESHPLRDVYSKMCVWQVMGKKDGYKHAGQHPKVDVGRTVQAPCFELKVIWKVVMGASDEKWGKRDWTYRTGYDFNRPLPPHLALQMAAALGVVAFDETAFDRRIPPRMLWAFFMEYLPMVVKGVSMKWLAYMHWITQDSIMQMTDGAFYVKHQGNPSGFMNTLRLNCIVQKLLWCIILTIRLEELGDPCEVDDCVKCFSTPDACGDIFDEICGDDSRVFAMTEKGMKILDIPNGSKAVLRIWEECFPWDVRVEGVATLDPKLPIAARMLLIPPFISRQVVVMDGYLWTPLCCPSRCLKRLSHVEELGKEERQNLHVSAYAALPQHIFWASEGLLCLAAKPFLESVAAEYPNVDFDGMIARMMYGHYTMAQAFCWTVDTLQGIVTRARVDVESGGT